MGGTGGTKQQDTAPRSGESSSSPVKDDDTGNDAALLPDNRFALELEFLQALASPAYLHFLATTRCSNEEDEDELDVDTAGSAAAAAAVATSSSSTATTTTYLQDPNFHAFLKYLRDTYSQPDYIRFVQYPHALFFLQVLIEQQPSVLKEWTLPEFRNFCHQQQFLAWQHRHATVYGVGSSKLLSPNAAETGQPLDDEKPTEME